MFICIIEVLNRNNELIFSKKYRKTELISIFDCQESKSLTPGRAEKK